MAVCRLGWSSEMGRPRSRSAPRLLRLLLRTRARSCLSLSVWLGLRLVSSQPASFFPDRVHCFGRKECVLRRGEYVLVIKADSVFYLTYGNISRTVGPLSVPGNLLFYCAEMIGRGPGTRPPVQSDPSTHLIRKFTGYPFAVKS